MDHLAACKLPALTGIPQVGPLPSIRDWFHEHVPSARVAEPPMNVQQPRFLSGPAMGSLPPLIVRERPVPRPESSSFDPAKARQLATQQELSRSRFAGTDAGWSDMNAGPSVGPAVNGYQTPMEPTQRTVRPCPYSDRYRSVPTSSYLSTIGHSISVGPRSSTFSLTPSGGTSTASSLSFDGNGYDHSSSAPKKIIAVPFSVPRTGSSPDQGTYEGLGRPLREAHQQPVRPRFSSVTTTESDETEDEIPGHPGLSPATTQAAYTLVDMLRYRNQYEAQKEEEQCPARKQAYLGDEYFDGEGDGDDAEIRETQGMTVNAFGTTNGGRQSTSKKRKDQVKRQAKGKGKAREGLQRETASNVCDDMRPRKRAKLDVLPAPLPPRLVIRLPARVPMKSSVSVTVTTVVNEQASKSVEGSLDDGSQGSDLSAPGPAASPIGQEPEIIGETLDEKKPRRSTRLMVKERK